jgi:hypothetical protein
MDLPRFGRQFRTWVFVFLLRGSGGPSPPAPQSYGNA